MDGPQTTQMQAKRVGGQAVYRRARPVGLGSGRLGSESSSHLLGDTGCIASWPRGSALSNGLTGRRQGARGRRRTKFTTQFGHPRLSSSRPCLSSLLANT